MLIVVDVALTETARLADYVYLQPPNLRSGSSPALTWNSQNGFHARHPLFPTKGETLQEAEIYTRLLEAMGEIPKRFPVLSRIAKYEPGFSHHAGFVVALAATIAANKKLVRYGASVLYRTLARC